MRDFVSRWALVIPRTRLIARYKFYNEAVVNSLANWRSIRPPPKSSRENRNPLVGRKYRSIEPISPKGYAGIKLRDRVKSEYYRPNPKI